MEQNSECITFYLKSIFKVWKGFNKGDGELFFDGLIFLEDFVIPLEGYVVCELIERGHDSTKIGEKNPIKECQSMK